RRDRPRVAVRVRRPLLRGRAPGRGADRGPPLPLVPPRERARPAGQAPRGGPCARQVVRSCPAAGFEPNVAFESDDYQTVQGLVAAGVGVALIPELALSGSREDIAIRALSPRNPVRDVIVATPAGTRLTAAATAMRQIISDVASRFVGP